MNSRRIFVLLIVLGSVAYGSLAAGSALRTWRNLPATLRTLEREATPGAQTQAAYLRSPWHQGQVLLTFVTGALFLAGALGLWAGTSWARMTLFGGAWVAMAHLAWTLITSLEWFRTTGTGMLYQVNLLNVAWVLLILAVAPTERLTRS